MASAEFIPSPLRGNALNRLTQAVDSSTGTITRAYDGLDRLTSETTPQGSVSYGYDAANRRTSATVTGQTGVSYSYDNANRLAQIAQGSSTVSFAYDNANRRTSLTLPNGVSISYGYDNASELTGISYALGQNSLGNLSYSYDLAGRRTSVGGSLAAVNLPNAISTTAYDAANELTQWGTATPTYDANGNTLSDGTNTYVWNARNQLASMNLTGETFQYDPFGRRVSKAILGTATNYLYDGANPVQELSGTTPTANMLTGGVDEYFTRTDSTGTANFLTDALGSTISLTNSSGDAIASYTYEPFGNTTAAGSSTNTYQYTGRENDGAVYFYRARYYSPGVERFLSEDPLGIRAGPNFYVYVQDEPADLIDPFGLQGSSFYDNALNTFGDTWDNSWTTIANRLPDSPAFWNDLANLGNFSNGAVDVLSGGTTYLSRHYTNVYPSIDENSRWYLAGRYTGFAILTCIATVCNNDNPFLRFGKGYDPEGNEIQRFASGGRFFKGGPKLPWHWHWP